MKNTHYLALRRFILSFTEDLELTDKIIDDHFQDLLDAETGPPAYLPSFNKLLLRARSISLDAMQGRPLPAKCWSERKIFFPIPPSFSELHKEIFCLRFYRGLSTEETALRLGISEDDTKKMLREVTQSFLGDRSALI